MHEITLFDKKKGYSRYQKGMILYDHNKNFLDLVDEHMMSE